MDCDRCQAPNRAERRFCGACGVRLWEPCPRCAFPNERSASFCGGCGDRCCVDAEVRQPAPAPQQLMQTQSSSSSSSKPLSLAAPLPAASAAASAEVVPAALLAQMKAARPPGTKVQEEKAKVTQDEIESLFR
jgi:hypothetical protein